MAIESRLFTRVRVTLTCAIDFSVVELPKKGDEEQVRLVYSIADEGDKVFINQIIINGVTGDLNTRRTKRRAIRRAIPIAEGDVLQGRSYLRSRTRALSH